MPIFRSLCLSLAVIGLASAAEGDTGIHPAPRGEPQHAPIAGQPGVQPARIGSPMPMRPSMAFEVEMLVVKPNDTAALARWADLAASGFHVVANTATADGGVSLCLERTAMGAGNLRLPAQVEQEPATAQTLRARIQATQAERQANLQPRPPMIPGTPAAAPPSAPAPTK